MLIGDTTALAVADVAELGEQQRLELKGKAEPVAARLVTGLLAEALARAGDGSAEGTDPWPRCRALRTHDCAGRSLPAAPESVLIVAPPGVGKSRLLREVASIAGVAAETAVWRTRARHGDGTVRRHRGLVGFRDRRRRSVALAPCAGPGWTA